MIEEISHILMQFRECFSRGAAFHWFVIVIMGFIIRVDHHGVSSIIRWLGLKPSLYTALLSFFRASSWHLHCIQQRWWHIVLSHCPLLTVDNRCLIAGDGIKVAKEAEKMPAVKKLHQESENSGKPPYIYGHHHGVLGILAGWLTKIFCVPLCAELHEGTTKLRRFQDKSDPLLHNREKVSITTLMAAMAVGLVQGLNRQCLIVLDAYFAVGPVFLILQTLLTSQGKRLVHVVTRAKRNVVGYEDPPPKTGRKGRPPTYGNKVKLIELFERNLSDFKEASLELYREKKTVLFLCLDLLWKPIGDKVRFALVIDGDEHFILMCSDVTLSPQDVITAYSYRFKIEVSFKVLKHLMGVFFYHFWTSVWPEIGKNVESDVSSLSGDSERLIAQTTNAIEGFVNFGCIATGILQIIALNFHNRIWKSYRGWLRTITSFIPTEETARSVIQEEFFHNFRSFNTSAIYRIIMSKSRCRPHYPRAAVT